MNSVDVVVVTVSELARIEGDKTVPISAGEYLHNENFIPSRNVRATRKGHDFHIGTVDGVPKRNPRPHFAKKGSTNDNKGGDIPTCHRDPEILGEYDAKHGIFRINDNNGDMVHTFSASGLSLRSQNENICLFAADAYMRLKSLAVIIYNHIQQINVDVPEEFTSDESDPKYMADKHDFLINRVLTDYFNQDIGMLELREKIGKERRKLESQLRTEDEDDVTESVVEEDDVEAVI